jgi:hypothetical protein
MKSKRTATSCYLLSKGEYISCLYIKLSMPLPKDKKSKTKPLQHMQVGIGVVKTLGSVTPFLVINLPLTYD